MIEVELKAWLENERKLEQQLDQIGAKYLKTVNQSDIYFNHPKKDFKKTDEALRIRQEENKYILTYKGPKLDKKSKTREELEVRFEEQIKLQEILEKLGFKEVYEVKKSRKLFDLDGIKISIDNIEDLGTFIELETEIDSKEDVLNAVNLLLAKLKLLGISETKTERRSYLELLLEKFQNEK